MTSPLQSIFVRDFKTYTLLLDVYSACCKPNTRLSLDESTQEKAVSALQFHLKLTDFTCVYLNLNPVSHDQVDQAE